MNCIKSVHILRDYGTTRLTVISVFAMLLFFSVFYSTFMIINPQIHLAVFHLLPFLGGLLLIYPVHKIFHCLPLWICGQKSGLSVNIKSKRYPVLYCSFRKAISRNLALASVAFPGVMITLLALIAASFAPEYIHYLAFLSTVNFGLSVVDFIYAVFLVRTPTHAYIEDFRDGFHILIRTI